jgi:hypothetical protein
MSVHSVGSKPAHDVDRGDTRAEVGLRCHSSDAEISVGAALVPIAVVSDSR